MNKKYLIIACDELGDQYECDANREPITMTEDWKAWYKKENPDYCFEVWEFNGQSFERIKDYDCPMEEGMIFLAGNANDLDLEDEDSYTIMGKYPDLDRHSPLPQNVLTLFNKRDFEEDGDSIESLHNCGSLAFYHGDTAYVYTEYHDNKISSWY